MLKKEKSDYIIKSVVHALDVLEQFHGSEGELGVSELSRRLNMHKNNVFRLLVTLASRNYIEQNKNTENYRLGLKNLELGQTVINQMGLHRQAKPVLEKLAGTCKETCYVTILRGPHIVNIDAVESDQPVRIVPRVGVMIPAHLSAAGKVLLAGAAVEEQKQCLSEADLRKTASPAAISLQEFKKELNKATVCGYAVEDEEQDAGVRGIAVPIRNHAGNIVGAIGISGPAIRFSESRMYDELVPMAKSAAGEISRQLGYCSPDDVAV